MMNEADFGPAQGPAIGGAKSRLTMKTSPRSIQSITLAGVLALASIAPADLLANDSGAPFQVSTLAHGVPRTSEGGGTPIGFIQPGGVAVDGFGNVYVSDTDREMGSGNTIWKITPGGVVGFLAGARASRLPFLKDGPADTAVFSIPEGLAVDNSGAVYVADSHNHAVRKISTDNMVTTIGRVFSYPLSVAVDSERNVYVADTYNHVIRKITPTGAIQTVAGDARFYYPSGVALDDAGNLFVTESWNYTVRKITPEGVVTTIAGAAGVSGSVDGNGSAARFGPLGGIAVDRSGNIYVTEPTLHTLRRITPSGTVTTVAGMAGVSGNVDGEGSVARFYFPVGVAVDSAGAVYVADMGNDRVRVVTPLGAPVIGEHPASQTIAKGSTVAFAVTAAGSAPSTFQWEKDGETIAGATNSTLVITAATEADAGDYSCVVANLSGTATSHEATLTVADAANASRIVNLSVRAAAGMEGQPLIVGFFVGGSGTTGSGEVLVRAAGPALSEFDVSNVLADPHLTLLQGGTVIASNDNWATPASSGLAAQAAASKTGAFPFPNLAGLDAALVPKLPQINVTYTAWITGTAPGTTLAEIYDRTSVHSPTTPRLINVSARAQVGPSPDVVIAGFVIGGTTAKTVLIRAIGPSLAEFGVDAPLQSPQLELHTKLNGADAIIATNAGWGGDEKVSAIGSLVGAFPIASTTSADAAIVRSLAPGAYTIHVTGLHGSAGSVLIEVYEVP